MNATNNTGAPNGSVASFASGARCALIALVWVLSLAISPAWAAPAIPAGLAAIAGNAENTLTWGGSAGAQWYLLYRGTESGGPYQFVARTRGVSYTDHGRTNGEPFHYVVSALDATGESGYSSQVTVTANVNVLPAPTQLEARGGNGQASLSWNPVASAVGYRVYRSATPGGPYTLAGPSAAGASFTDTGLNNGTKYHYVVQTLSTDSGAYSDEMTVTPSAELPAAPGNLVATPGSAWASLTWDAAAGATGYTVYRGSAVGGPYSFAGFTPTTSYEESGLNNGTTYYYVVAAQNGKGEGAWSSERSAALSEIERPHAAKLKGALTQGGSLVLYWQENAPGAVSYRLQRSTTIGGPYTSLGVWNNSRSDNGLANGTTYYYVLDSLNASPVAARSNELALAPVAGGIPPVPVNVTAYAGNTTATVNWNPVAGIEGFSLIVATSPGGPDIGVSRYITGSTCMVQGLTNGVTYYFRVQAGGHAWSGYSSEVSATPLEELPVIAEGLAITGGNSELSVTWNPAPGATSYQVFRRTENAPWPAAPIATVTGTLFNDSGLTNGTSYFYQVAGVNASGTGARTYETSGTPAAPLRMRAPLNVAGLPGNTQASLTWDPVPGATSYSVTVATSPGGPNIYPGGYQMGPSATVTGLTNTEPYYFRVQAAGSVWSAYSAEVSATPVPTVPLAPGSLSVYPGNGELGLTWNKVANATSYRIFRRTEGNPWPATHLGTATGTLYTDSGLDNGTNYEYVVAAVGPGGVGARSYLASGIPTAAGRGVAPVNVAVQPGYTQATLTWDPVHGAGSYSVTVATAPGGPDIGASRSYNGPSCFVYGLTNGTTYYFRVQSASSDWSAFSAEVSGTPSSSRLLAPEGLAAASGVNGQLSLTWSPVAGATGYRIYRRSAAGAWPATPTATSATTGLVDSGLVNGTGYYYAVAASNASGGGAWSYPVSATPADTTEPDTAITANPANPSTSLNASFSFTSTKGGSTFQCQLDGGAWEGCSSPKSYSGLAAGSHDFAVKATDSFGNSDGSPAGYSWLVNTGITLPQGSIAINGGATVTDKTAANLTLSCSDANGCSQMQFSNDGSSWSAAEAYAAAKAWTLASGDGNKTVYVKFKDSLGYWSNPFSDTILLNGASKTLVLTRIGTGTGSVTSAPAGINCGAGCQASFASSTQVTLSAVAQAGSVFAGWGGDCSGNSASSSVTVNNTVICTARFESSAPVPPAPAGLAAINGNGEATLSWSASSGAQWYQVYRAFQSGGPYSFLARTRSLSHTDHSTPNDQPFFFVVSALNAAGESVFSNEAAVTATTAVLPAPMNLKAIPGNGQVSLTWDYVTSEVVYNVYRSITPGGPYTLLEPAAPGPSFTDTGLANGTQYYYVVQTLSTNSGAYSDQVSVTPSAELPVAPDHLTATPGSTWARLTWDAASGATGYAIFRGSALGGPYQYAGYTPTTSFEDLGLSNGTTYYYVVAGVNGKGRGAFSSESSAEVSDVEMPHAAVLKAQLTEGGAIILYWEQAAGAVSYILRRSTTPGGLYTSLGVKTAGYADTGLVNGTTYYYVLDSLNASPVIPRSNEVALAPVAGGVPAVPGNLAVANGNTRVTLTWNEVPGVPGYAVSVATSPGGPDIGAYSYVTGNSCVIANLTNGITYYFRVRSGAHAWSGDSSEVSATPSAALPVAPDNLSVVAGNTEISLTWSPAAGATGYQVFRRVESGPWSVSPIATVTGTLFSDRGLNNGTRYEYMVAGVNASGSGARCYPTSGTPAARNNIAPVQVAVLPGNTQATVTWDPVPGVESYTVTVAERPGGPNIYPGGYQMGPSATVTGLTNTKTYYFRVQAAVSYWSAYSEEVSVTPVSTVPVAPAGMDIHEGNSQLSLTWAKTPGATSYRIYRRAGENPWSSYLGSTATTLFTDSGVENGTTYQYVVAAVGAGGAGARSYVVTGTPAAAYHPAAPVKVAAVAGYTQTTVTWDPVPGASNYSLTVATTPGGPDIGASRNPAGASVTVTGLSNGTTYYFRVQAGASLWSAFSEEVSATPSAALLPAPEGVTAGSGVHRQLALSWSPVAGATGYRIYRRLEDTGHALVGSSLTGAFNDTGLENGTRYYYVVEAVNLSGPGAFSAETSSIPADSTAPTGTISINSGAGYTAGTTVTLTLSCSDDASCVQMQFSNDYGEWSTPQAYATSRSWVLTAGEGLKTVSVRYKDSSDNWSYSFSDTIQYETTQYQLSATIVGSGSVNSNPAGLACTVGSCSGSFVQGETVTLMPSAAAGYAFSGWSGACSNSSGNCLVEMTGAKSVTATFTQAPKAKIGATGYASLQAAYNAAVDDAVIKVLEGTVAGTLTAGRNVRVVIEGGYNASFSAVTSESRIQAPVLVRSGQVRMKKVKLYK